MAKLTGEMIKKGLRIWVSAYERSTMESMPVELVIVTGEVERDSNVVHVTFAENNDENLFFGVTADPENQDRRVIYLGDDGVRPYNYDTRCTQVFTTKDEVLQMLEMCAGRYPNFVCEDGSDKPSNEMSFADDFYDYDD